MENLSQRQFYFISIHLEPEINKLKTKYEPTFLANGILSKQWHRDKHNSSTELYHSCTTKSRNDQNAIVLHEASGVKRLIQTRTVMTQLKYVPFRYTTDISRLRPQKMT